MLTEINTVDTGQREDLPASSYWQDPEYEAPIAFVRRGRRVYHPYVEFIVSSDIHFPTPDIANETALTFFEGEFSSLNISYKNPEAISSYLSRYPEIEDFIETAWPALIECFDGPIDIVLEVITYPDESAHEELVGWIQSTDDVNEGLEKLERFEDEWFLDHMAEVDNKFNFNIETK